MTERALSLLYRIVPLVVCLTLFVILGVLRAPEVYWLAVAGATAAVARALFVTGQQELSAESGLDVIVGTGMGYLWNLPAFGLWPPFDLPEKASIGQRAFIVGLVVLVGVALFKKILFAVAPKLLERLGAVLPEAKSADAK